MFVPFRRYFSERKTQDVAARAAGSVARRLNRRRPTLESLETRNLLSFIGPEQRVSFNPQTTANTARTTPAPATGRRWPSGSTRSPAPTTTSGPSGSTSSAIRPAPIQVDFLGSDNSFDPHVSMDSTGNFVVAWENLNSDGTENIMMRYFSASGSPITDITRVSSPGSTDFNPDVAASFNSFVISWTHRFSATDFDIDAERFVIPVMSPAASSPPASRSAKASSASTPTRTSRTTRAWRCPRTGSSSSPMSGSFRAVTGTSLRVNITAPEASSAASLSMATALMRSSPASRWTTSAMP